VDVKEMYWVGFDYCLKRALNNILMNRVMKLEFHKFLGNLDKPNNNLRKYYIGYVFSFMVSSRIFGGEMPLFFSFTQRLN
jgi:hypothetical protein